MTDKEVYDLLIRIDRGYIPSDIEIENLSKISRVKWETTDTIPESICLLKRLLVLDLSQSKITELPESIGNLTSLQSLDLSDTQISELPEWIGSLTSLQSLDLHFTRISELPEWIGSLTSLQSLTLGLTQISKLPEWIGSLTSLQSLDLSGTGISELPEWISSLTSLQSLDLTGTGISELPVSIGSLTSLQRLDLSGSRISKLPEWIGSLTRLQSLDLSRTRISELPEWISSLTSLQGLDLSGTQISKLPKWISSLTSLQILYLSDTQISKLPKWISSLTSLQSLYLSYTRISELPKWISSLTSLQGLYLSGTRISELPESFGSLTSLQSLDLRNTRLSELPESFGKLTSLQSLDLNYTGLSELPESFGSLTSLQSLDLGNTQISELPEWIVSLTSLQSLDLSGTRISELPEWIVSLTSLQSLDLSFIRLSKLPESLLALDLNFINDYVGHKNGIYIKGLELQTQPISLFFQDRSLIENYYASKKTELKESKVIFMGDGGAGKSYTIQRIMNDGKNLDTDTEVTHDITIEHWDNKNNIVDFNGSIDFWDFGGQDIYLSMHRCFMTDRSCYVIVLCNRQYGSHRGLMRQARYWLKNISDHAKDSPILIAVNTWKGQPRDGISLTQLKKDFPELNIVDQIVYDAHDPNCSEFNRLTNRICRMAQNHFSFSLQFPVSWNNIRTRLRQDYSKDNYISEEEYYKICREELEKNDGYYDEGIAKWLLHWFNDLGYCFNYHDIDEKTDGEEYQVMKPQWVIRAMYKIINYKISYSPDSDRPIADTLSQSLAENRDLLEGIIPKKSIISLLTKKAGDEKPYTEQEAEYILRILQKYRLAYLIKRSPEVLFIPALCSDIRPEDFDDTGSEKVLKTEYVVRFKHLPETLMQHLLIACYQKGRIPDKVWQNGFHLYGDDEEQDLIIAEVSGDTEICIKYYVSEKNTDFRSLHKVRLWLKDIYTELGIENVRDFIIRRTEKQTAFISVRALINAYRDDPGLDKFYVQDDDIYQAYSVDELLTGLYGHDYKTVLGISRKDVEKKDPRRSDTAAFSESYINMEISRDLKIISSQLREIADKKAPLDNETAAVLTDKITASIDHHNSDTIAENVRLQELIKELKEAQEKNDKEKMQNLLSDSSNLTTVLSALTAFARYAGTLL